MTQQSACSDRPPIRIVYADWWDNPELLTVEDFKAICRDPNGVLFLRDPESPLYMAPGELQAECDRMLELLLRDYLNHKHPA